MTATLKFPDCTDGVEFARGTHMVRVPVGMTIEDLLSPYCWRNVSGNLRTHDRLEFVPMDGDPTMYMDAVVTGAGNGFVRILILNGHHAGRASLQAAPVMIGDTEYPCAKWGGPEHKFRVLGLDKQPAKDQNGKPMIGYSTKEEAEAALALFKTRAGIRGDAAASKIEAPKVEAPKSQVPLTPAQVKTKKFDDDLRALAAKSAI